MHLWRRAKWVLAAVILVGTSVVLVPPFRAAETPRFPAGAEFHVGIDKGDIRGADHRALQAAVDYVAGLGGGTVYIGPGRFQMRNALTLRDYVRVVGVPGKTILAACDGYSVRLAADGDCNQREITVTDPSSFRVGDGLAVVDSRSAGGFDVTTATITAKPGARTFRLSRPLRADYLVARQATVRLVFPIVGGWQVKNAAVEGLTLDGNRKKAQSLDGCRGGGIYLFECADVAIRNCTVRDYNGDGISFQVSRRVTVEGCQVKNNAGHGLHPGSGSQQPIVRRNRSTGNGQDGMFVCWRVQHGRFEDNMLQGNKRGGISIGHKDSDNLFRGNRITDNAAAGITFRQESEAMGAHRNRFEKNIILDNGGPGSRIAIFIQGEHHDLVFRGNSIGNSKAHSSVRVGIRTSESAKGLKADANDFRNVSTKIEVEKKRAK
jgi:parallel beta-helix repeat protein